MMADLKPYLQARLEPQVLEQLRFEQTGPLLGGTGEDRLVVTCGPERLELDGAGMTRLVLGSPDLDMEGLSAASGSLRDALAAIFPLPSFLPGLNYH